MQPITAVAEADFAMLARNMPARVGQRPVEMRIAPDIEAASLDFNAQRPPVGQSIQVFDCQTKRHTRAQNLSPPAAKGIIIRFD